MGAPGGGVGLSTGASVGSTGSLVGRIDGAGLGITEGAAVGAKRTKDTPDGPETAERPVHAVLALQPSRMM